MPIQVFDRSNCLAQYTWGQGCYGWTFIDTDELSVKQELMPEDTAEELHYHNQSSQFFFILAGEATFEIEEEEIVLRKQQGITIKPGQKHRIINRTPVDLEFILYSQPSAKNDRINC